MAQRARIGEQIKDAMTRDLVNACATLGYKAALDAYRNHTYQHRTYALHDSYGSAVYLDGRLVPETIRYVNRSRQTRGDNRGWRGASDPEGTKGKNFDTGRKALQAYLENPPRMSKRSKGITIMVVAAQWYATILEGKGYTVLDPRTVSSSITYNFDAYIAPILDKYGMKKFAPKLRRDLGADQFFIQDQEWRY
jgi:hypothetical protein